MKHLSTTILIAALVLLPLAALAEQGNIKVWTERLIWPDLEEEPSRHTPRYSDGTILPPQLTGTHVFTAADNPVVLTGTTRLEAGSSVTLAAGTLVVAHEFALLEVAGTLVLEGEPANPVVFTTNELHPENQTWGGITVTDSGHLLVTHTAFRQADPAVTCLPGARAFLSNIDVAARTLGMFIASPACSIQGSVIRSIGDGIVAVDVEPPIANTTFFVGQDDIKRITNP